MDPTLTALREHMLSAAPETLYMGAALVHRHRACPSDDARGPTSPSRAVDLALSQSLGGCHGCLDNDWAHEITRAGRALPSNGAFTRTPDLASARHMSTPMWLHADPSQPSACCEPAHATSSGWGATLNRLRARRVHHELTQAAAAYGPPTTWVALPLRSHLVRSVELPSTVAHHVAPLAYFHPWAVARTPGSLLGMAVMHLPDTLADNLKALGATALREDLIDPLTWQVADRLIRDALDNQDPLTVSSARERALVEAAPHLFEVAHAATH